MVGVVLVAENYIYKQAYIVLDHIPHAKCLRYFVKHPGYVEVSMPQ